jgi:hypothetical protein
MSGFVVAGRDGWPITGSTRRLRTRLGAAGYRFARRSNYRGFAARLGGRLVMREGQNKIIKKSVVDY